VTPKSKTIVIVFCQIGLIVGSFLGVAIWESKNITLGHSLDVAGKNRLLTSLFLNEVIDHAYVKLPDSDPIKSLNDLERNILLLKNGGIFDGVKILPLDDDFNNSWVRVYDKFIETKSNYKEFQTIQTSELSPFDITDLEIDVLVLINYSDNLARDISHKIDDTAQTLIIIQLLLLVVNVTVHIGLIWLILRIFKTEFKQNLKLEKLATVGELSSRLAHDMRNPLSVINLSTQLIKSKTSEKDISEKLKVIEDGIFRLSHQINDVMDFVRTKEPNLKLWNLNSILQECIERLSIPKSVNVTLPEKSVLIKCDRSQFDILFINLLSNSLDSIGSEGSINIKVNKKSNSFVIDVIDSGNGIPKEELENIFDPLITFKENGTGLGLASCKNIVENHKGTITAFNNPTTFRIYIPT